MSNKGRPLLARLSAALRADSGPSWEGDQTDPHPSFLKRRQFHPAPLRQVCGGDSTSLKRYRGWAISWQSKPRGTERPLRWREAPDG